MNEIKWDELASAALKMRTFSYVPYSKFAVGAALLSEDGEVYTGCNIENASYPVGICAERTAFSKAVSEGVTRFRAIVIVGGPKGDAASELCPPCGMCRQFMREFCSGDFPVALVRADEENRILETKIFTLSELLPESFGPENLDR